MQRLAISLLGLASLIVAPPVEAAPRFVQGESFPVGQFPEDLALGDLDGDGLLDVVTLSSSGFADVRLGIGDGTFGEMRRFFLGAGPVDLRLADLERDGDLDIVTANPTADNVSVLFGNGDGSFQTALLVPACDGPFAVGVGEFTGDVTPDLVVGCSGTPATGGALVVLRGNGQGGFVPEAPNPTDHGEKAIAVGDFDGDSRLDVVVTNFQIATTRIFFGKGDGTFSGSNVFAVDAQPSAAAVGHLDGDGFLDLVVASFPGSVRVFLGSGDGRFRSELVIDTATVALGINSVAIADVDGDAAADLVLAGGNTRSTAVLLGAGDGTFPTRLGLPAGNGTRAVAVGELDGDALPDILALNRFGEDVTVLLGRGALPPVSFSFGAPALVPSVGSPASVAAADVDLDGATDLLVPDAQTNQVGVLLGLGDGAFESAASLQVGSSPVAIATGDLNDDGRVDFITINTESPSGSNTASVRLGRGDGSFESVPEFFVARDSQSLAIGDGTNDAIPDLVTAQLLPRGGTLGFFPGNGDGTFQPETFGGQSPLSGVAAVALADLNGDSHADLIVALASRVQVRLGNGDGTFTISGQTTKSVGDAPRAMALADLDRDGVLDIALANDLGDSVSVLISDGTGRFRSGSSFGVGSAPVGVAAADLDRDGILDLVTVNSASGDVSLLAGQGDGSFQDAISMSAAAGPTAVAVVDLDGDSLPDIAVPTAGSDVLAVFLNLAAAPDSDGDGSTDDQDNCRLAFNADQADSGGVGAGSPPDGIGDACQCGDVSRDGQISLVDVVLYRRTLSALPPTPTFSMEALGICSVVGNASSCTDMDVTRLRRTLVGRAIVEQVCPAAAEP